MCIYMAYVSLETVSTGWEGEDIHGQLFAHFFHNNVTFKLLRFTLDIYSYVERRESCYHGCLT